MIDFDNMTIFVCIYGNETSRKAPKGLSLKTESWDEANDIEQRLMAEKRLEQAIQTTREQAISRITVSNKSPILFIILIINNVICCKDNFFSVHFPYEMNNFCCR